MHRRLQIKCILIASSLSIVSILCFGWRSNICRLHPRHQNNICHPRCYKSRSGCNRNNCHWILNSKPDDPYTDGLQNKSEEEERARSRRRSNLEHWGAETATANTYNQKPAPIFPNTFDALAEDAYYAIRGTILGLQRPDPNAAVNAMHHSVLDYRPTQPSYASSQNLDEEYSAEKWDSKVKSPPTARMGIEIDGAAVLFSSDNGNTNGDRGVDEGRALRILSLKIADRLSRLHDDEHTTSQPVAVYYNSMKETLLASNELRLLKQARNDSSRASLDQVQIFCVGLHSLPENMLMRKRSKDAAKGIILIIKPSDYTKTTLESLRGTGQNRLYPTVHSDIIDKLQKLLFQAAASSIPAVVMSPRLSDLPPMQQYSSTHRYKTGPSGFEQSGFQQSASYGGCEPPVGPTSWLLRDLIPPVYVWVGCSFDLLRKAKIKDNTRKIMPSIASLIAMYGNDHFSDKHSDSIDDGNEEAHHVYTRLALTQTCMDTGHMYRLFAVKETAEFYSRQQKSKAYCAVWKSNYEFVGSLKSSLGRPTSEVMYDMYEDWNENRNNTSPN